MKRKLIKGLLMWIAVVLCVMTAYADDTFSCAATDEQGNVIHGYYDEEDTQWYLFLTNNVSIPDLDVELRGEVSSTDKGTVDQQTNTLHNAFAESGDSVTLQLAGGETEKITVMQSALPSMYIELNSVTLDEVHQDKDVKYDGTQVIVTDIANTKNNLHVTDATFKGRGNSSWACYEKKGYQLKFDKKTSVLGMAKAKKWVLLANASDDSMMRNQLAFHLADQLGMPYVPDSAYVDLWINGDYRGTYLVCEKVEIGSSRVDLKDPKGVLMEQDEAFYADEDIWIQNDGTGKHFVLKESVTEDDQSVIQEAVQGFDDALNEFMDYLLVTPDGDITLDALSQYIDVDSFLQYYLVNEYTLNRESATTSFYWYKDGDSDVLHLGPVWDFDTCMGNDLNDTESYKKMHICSHIVYQRLLSIPVVQDELKKLYEYNESVFKSTNVTINALYEWLQSSANMNYTRWKTLINGFSGKGTFFAASYQEATRNLKNWLDKREKSFPLEETLQCLRQTTVYIDEEEGKLNLTFKGADDCEDLWFVIWSEVNGRDDIIWHKAIRQAEGVWDCEVDLSQHHSTGIYDIHIWGGNAGKATAFQQSLNIYVRKEFVESPSANVEVSPDYRTMKIFVKNAGDYDQILLPVWSEDDGQDDLVWYDAEKQANGTWAYTVDLANHNSVGTYQVHVYGKKDGELQLIAHTTADVAELTTFATARVSQDCRTMRIIVNNAGDYDHVYLPVWSEIDGQDDLVWYDAVRQADGTWAYTVNLTQHQSAGKYQIHVYGEKDESLQMLTHTTAQVERVPRADELYAVAEVSADCRTMQLAVRNTGDYNQVYFPVWSEENGQDDIEWCAAVRQKDGSWTCTVDLTAHHSAGTYQIHVYGEKDGALQMLTQTTADVEQIALPDTSYVTAEVSTDCRTMQLVAKNISNCDQVYLPTWSEENGQDDIEWYAAVQQTDGDWTYAVDLTKHHSAGAYQIHVYGRKDGELQMLALTAVNVDRIAS